MRLLLVALVGALAVWCLLLNHAINRFFAANVKTPPIEEEVFPTHSTREAFPGAKDRVYIILGGSGFTGAWFTRYLILRKERAVIILDKRRPPADLTKHGAIFMQTDLTRTLGVESVFKTIASTYCHTGTKVIFYNCTCSRRFDEPRFAPEVDPGLQIAEVISFTLNRFIMRNVVFIHIGDSMSNRQPVSWSKFWSKRDWLQHSRSDTASHIPWSTEGKCRAFSVYAWYQAAIEAELRSVPGITTGCIRSEGFISGHHGDHFLTPSVTYNGGLLHSAQVPISLIHVEDLVRASLALEYLLLDPKTAEEYSGSVFTVAGDKPTTLRHVYNRIKLRQPTFREVQIAPVVAYLFGCVMSLTSFLWTPLTYHSSDRMTSVLCGGARTLTLERFSTLQIGQFPNKHNTRRTAEILRYRPNYSNSQIIDTVVQEIAEIEKRRQKKKN